MSPFNVSGIAGADSAARILGNTFDSAARSLKRISSGLRINSAADDPAGLSISENLRAEVRGLNRMAMNAMDEMSMIQVADAGAAEIQGALQNIAELSVQAANGVYTDDQRAMIQQEIDAKMEHIDSVAENTQFNSKQLLTGGLGVEMGSGAVGLAGVDVSSASAAANSISMAQNAISQVSEMRGELSATQNSLASSIRSMDVTAENTLAAESRIRDADMAAESVKLASAMIMAEAGMAALAQANVQSKAASMLFGM